MIAFLTSNVGLPLDPADRHGPFALNEKNGFVERLRKAWIPSARCLFVASDPDNTLMVEGYGAKVAQAFAEAGLPFSKLDLWDSRRDYSAEEVRGYDVLFLSGGHVPTQNAFFQRIGLREKLAGFDGIIIGVSAGTMNSAGVVYAAPELEGESIDPEYRRFLPGLGLTQAMVVPHYQHIKNDMLDGKRMFEEIIYPDSIGRTFYALVDGSYLLVEDGRTTLYGEAYQISDGALQKLTSPGEVLPL